MPPARADRRPLARAGVGLGAIVLAAVALDGGGLLVPAASPTASQAAVLRLAGVVAAVVALVGLCRRREVGLRRAPAVVAIAGAVAATVALLSLPASDVGLSWFEGEVLLEPPPDDDAAPPPADPGEAPPPVLRLPDASQLQVRPGELWVILPDGGEAFLGPTAGDPTDDEGDGDSDLTALRPGSVGGVVADPGGGLTVLDDAGGTLAQIPPGGPGLDLGDARVESAGGGGLLEVDDGAVTDAGGGASGQLELLPEDEPGPDEDLLATVAGIALGVATFWLVFVHSPRHQPRRRPAPEPSPLAARARPVDPEAAEAGLHATLDAMLGDPDPRTAIVGAYAVLLAALENARLGRRPEEAPHEHLHRALDPLGARTAPVHDLADLFVLARFSPAPLTDAHRDTAIAALRQAVGRIDAEVLV